MLGVVAVLEYAVFLVFPAALAFAGAMDLFTMTIPNRISLVLIATFPIAAYLTGMSWMDLGSHVGAGALMLVIGFGMFARGWLGGGDAKLLAAASLWFGFENLGPYLLLAALAGGVLAFVILMYRRIAPPLWLCNQSWAMRLHSAKTGIPYGIALAAAGLKLYPSTAWFTSLAT